MDTQPPSQLTCYQPPHSCYGHQSSCPARHWGCSLRWPQVVLLQIGRTTHNTGAWQLEAPKGALGVAMLCGLPGLCARVAVLLSEYMGGGGGVNLPCAEVPKNNLQQSNVQLACQACFQQFKENRNCELVAGTKLKLVSKASTRDHPFYCLATDRIQ